MTLCHDDSTIDIVLVIIITKTVGQSNLRIWWDAMS